MTREQAAEALQQGNKIRHKYFTNDEYCEIKNGRVTTEDGYDFNDQFFDQDTLADGWSIVPETVFNSSSF